MAIGGRSPQGLKKDSDMNAGAFGLAGTALEVGAGLVDSNARKKAAKRAETSAEFGGRRPKHRKIQRVMNTAKKHRDKKKQGLATLAQATMDWADRV